MNYRCSNCNAYRDIDSNTLKVEGGTVVYEKFKPLKDRYEKENL